MSPRVVFKTIGCRLNQAETALITAAFRGAGYDIVPFGSACEAAVIHGCAITGKAERDSVRAARQARRAAPAAVVVMAGCPAETLGDTLRGEAMADLIVGQSGKFDLPALLHRLHPDRFPPSPSDSRPVPPAFDTTRALVKVQDGCDFGCAYCIVPRARGRPHSRPLADVTAELQRTAAAGFREVVLTGANLGCYADGPHRLIDVVRAAESLPGLDRIRLSSIEITTTERAIVDHMAVSEKLCRFLHLPLQSGDATILGAMGRRYTPDEYRAVVDYAVSRIPDLGLGADVIVGFPGEDDAAFEAGFRLIEALPFSNLHVFPYSRREGTRAATLPGQIPAAVKKERVHRLLDLAARKRDAFARRFLGRTVSVLVERVDDKGQARGWTGEYLEARMPADQHARNRLVAMRVDRIEAGRLIGAHAEKP